MTPDDVVTAGGDIAMHKRKTFGNSDAIAGERRADVLTSLQSIKMHPGPSSFKNAEMISKLELLGSNSCRCVSLDVKPNPQEI